MGGAVLIGLLDSLYPEDGSTTSTKISTFIACTKSKPSAQRLQENLGRHASRVKVLASQNEAAIREADVVVLGFKPWMAEGILGEPTIAKALEGKFVISLIAGKTVNDIRGFITAGFGDEVGNVPYVAKAIPNVAARYRQSITIFELSEPYLPKDHSSILEFIFSQVGTYKYIPTDQINNAGMLITNCLASLSVPLEGLLDGAVVGGLRRNDAMELAIQGIMGFGTMLQHGTHPAVMRESISSPKGSTIQSLMTVEKAATRHVFAQAQIDGTDHLKPAHEKTK